MTNVAIVGEFASGKTTTAVELTKRGFSRLSFADFLKDIAQRVYGNGHPVYKTEMYTVTRLDGTVEQISGRQVLQELGQSVKSLDRDFWIKAALARVKKLGRDHIGWVLDDCRFPYEAEALRDAGFAVVKLDVPEFIRMERYERLYGRLPTEAELNHPSETEVRNIVPDVVISPDTATASEVADMIEQRLAERRAA